jgi:threonine synthase
MSTLIHLECSRCGRTCPPGKVYNRCECGSPLFARYDLMQAAKTMTLDSLQSRAANLWRYREVLPVRDERNIVSLGEGFTPLLHAARLGPKTGVPNLYLKEEGVNPTGSFKARGMAAAISMAKELGIRKVAVPSAGNAGGAMAAYAARAGMEARIFVPQGTPLMNRLECPITGAQMTLVEGSIKDCDRVMRETLDMSEWFDVSTLKEPYRVEGKKTMAFEVFEQLGGTLPDAMIYPTGGGTGLVGMWKAFGEMELMGWIGRNRPRMFAVQAAACAPMVRAFRQGSEQAEEWQNPTTVASGMRVPSAVGDFLILRALRESGGAAVAVTDEALLAATRTLAETEGVLTAPEGGATLAAMEQLLAEGVLSGEETVVLFLTGSAYKYLEVMRMLAKN